MPDTKDRAFEFTVERAVFVSVLQRLFVAGSDRACEQWMADYKIPGIEELQRHHLYRAMAWLGEMIVNPTTQAAKSRRVAASSSGIEALLDRD